MVIKNEHLKLAEPNNNHSVDKLKKSIAPYLSHIGRVKDPNTE